VRRAAGELQQAAVDEADGGDADDLPRPAVEAREQIRVLDFDCRQRAGLVGATSKVKQPQYDDREQHVEDQETADPGSASGFISGSRQLRGAFRDAP